MVIGGDGMKNLFRIILLGLLVFFLPHTVAHAGTENGVGIEDNRNGTVTIKYSNSSNANIAVTVKKNGTNTQYNYFLSDREIVSDIPLTGGNGVYQISVLKNVVDSKYSPLSSEQVSLVLKDSKSAFTTSNEMITWEHTNNAIKKANQLTFKYKSQSSKIKSIYKYLVTNYHYDYDKYGRNTSGDLSYYTPDIDKTYAEKKGICYDMAALTASMMRSVGVQTQMVTGYPTSKYYNGSQYHAWNKVYFKRYRKWVVMDITCDMCLYEQGTKYTKLTMKKRASEYSNVRYIW